MCIDEKEVTCKDPFIRNLDIHLEYYNILVMEDSSDPHFTIGNVYSLHECVDSEAECVLLINDLGEEHYFDPPGYRDLMGFSIDDYFRVIKV